MTRTSIGALSLALCAGTASTVRAADVTWDNGSSNFLWDTSSLNWTGAAWNNAAGNGAIFGAAGVGTLNVLGPINLNSVNFTADGYMLNGAGSLNIVSGVSTQTTGVVNVATGATAKINVPVFSSLGFQKVGAGVLELSAPCSFGGGIPLTDNGLLRTDLLVGGTNGPIASGTLRLMNSGVVPASTRASIANGLLDIGSNTVTLSALTFVNQMDFVPFNPAIGAAGAGVIGSGTLRVTGDINVIGVFDGNNGSNSIAANLDMGGGTQIIRSASNSSFGLSSSLQLTGSLSNGSLLKTWGVIQTGVQSATDGMGLFGNNTYTGSTVLNGGYNVVTGTNASTSVKITGQSSGAGTNLVLQGANGSYQSAALIQSFAAGTLILDNNAAIGAGTAQPATPAAQNNNRIRDDAEIQLRDANFTYRGLATAAASETFGNLNVLSGHNVVTLTPNGAGGSVTVTANGNLSLAPRATMQVASTTLGAASKLFVNGTTPAADATGILPRMVGTNDYLTYNAGTGLTPYTGYALDFSTAGTNVAVTAASTVASSVNINALKRTGTFTTTIGAGQTLGITSGMILSTSGTGTITGGTIDFGSKPGVVFGGTNNISSAITGSGGFINANGTVTLSGDLSGLSGLMTQNGAGTLNLATNTFGGALQVRNGILSLNTSQTLAGQGAITFGVPENDANLVGTLPTLSFSAAGANAVIGRDIIADNGALTAAGAEFRFGLIPTLSPLSNTTGSQTLSGNILINTPLKLQGGGGGGTGSTNFTGNVTGASYFYIPNGRANLSGAISNVGGFRIGEQGFTAQVTFSGTASGNGPIRISGGNNMQMKYNAGSLPGGPISIFNASSGTPVNIFPLNNSSISNSIDISGNAVANVGAGITAAWAGVMSGASPLSKSGTGTLVISNPFNTFTGMTSVTAGTLQVDGSLLSSSVSVVNTGTLSGIGSIAGSTLISIGGVIAPGNSIGTLATGSLNLLGSLRSEVDLNAGGSPLADLLNIAGSVTLTNATLDLPLLNLPPTDFAGGTYLLVANDGADAVSGVFGMITGLPAGYSATIDYAYIGADSLGRTGDGNDIAVHVVPAPPVLLMISGFGAAQLGRRRRR